MFDCRKTLLLLIALLALTVEQVSAKPTDHQTVSPPVHTETLKPVSPENETIHPPAHHTDNQQAAHHETAERPDFVQPGPLETMRAQLLDQIKAAENRGVGAWTYRAEFKKLNHFVKSGASEDNIKSRVMSIVTSLHGQIRTSARLKQAAIDKARHGRTLTKENLLYRPR